MPTQGGIARDRGTPRDATPPTPPGIRVRTNGVLCVKFCKRRSFVLVLGGLAELGFLVVFEIVHVEVAVGLEPVFMGFDGEGSDEATAGG